MKTTWQIAATVMVAVVVAACGGGGAGGGAGKPPAGAGPDGKVRVASNPSDQWALVPAAEVGMDGALLAAAIARLPDGKVHGVSSMLVMRRGKPVLEQYWNGYDKDTLHDIRSATKSITSMLMGIAIDRKLVGGVKDSLSSHLGALYPNAPAFRLAPNLQHLLTMRSGLDCDDWNTSTPGHEDKMYNSGDWIKFYTSVAAIDTPGTVTRYCTGNPMALGRVIAQASKKTIPAFAGEFLFGPLDIVSARWASFDNGAQTDTGGHVLIRPRDMAKLGQLALQKGMWNGKQLISSAWMEESMAAHTGFYSLPRRNEYGYLWWRSVEQVLNRPEQMIFADGNGGQHIFIVPAAELVVVFTGENYNSSASKIVFELLDQYILPSVKN